MRVRKGYRFGGETDPERLALAMEKIARGLLFHIFGAPFEGELTIFHSLLATRSEIRDKQGRRHIFFPHHSTLSQMEQLFKQLVETTTFGVEEMGVFPETFRFAGYSDDNFVFLRMVFFSRFPVYALTTGEEAAPASSKPFVCDCKSCTPRDGAAS